MITPQFVRKASALLFLLFALAAFHSTHAATITWGTPTMISGTTDVSTTGSLLYAYDMGDTGVPSETINGVTFASFAAPNATTSTASVTNASLTLAAGNQDSFHSTNTGVGYPAPPFSNLPATYQGLLGSGVSTTNTADAMALTLMNLTSGRTYQVEFWVNDSATPDFSNYTSPADSTTISANNSVSLQMNTAVFDTGPGGVGQYVTGTFTANATTQGIVFGSKNGQYPILNAFQVRNISAVPEPSTWIAAGLLVAGVTVRHWRGRKTRQSVA